MTDQQPSSYQQMQIQQPGSYQQPSSYQQMQIQQPGPLNPYLNPSQNPTPYSSQLPSPFTSQPPNSYQSMQIQEPGPLNPYLNPSQNPTPYSSQLPSPYPSQLPPSSYSFQPSYSYASPYHQPPSSTASRVDQKDSDPSAPLRGVIITIWGGSSYDGLFRTVPQLAPGGRISVFQLPTSLILHVYEKFNSIPYTIRDQKLIDLVDEIVKDIETVNSESVVFNWECCSEFGSSCFGGHVVKFMKLVLDRGHMLMCSDFSLKSLISSWDVSCLGPCAFQNIGNCSGSIDLKFDPSILINCPSAQLQKVGQLCQNGNATIKAMSSTIVYTVDPKAFDVKEYKVQVLTVATNSGGFSPAQFPLVQVGSYQGTAGHVLLRYPSGGILLCSAGHWLELLRLDVSMESLLSVAAKEYGNTYSAGLESQLKSASPMAQQQMVQQYAAQFVQQSSPCLYSPQKK